MAESEEDFSQLPLPDRFTHKQWKVRKEGYEAAAKEFEKTPDESDPVFRPFVQDSSLWKGAAGDANVAAQQEGLAALCAFLKYGGQQGASRSRGETVQPIYEKGLSSTRPAIKASALEALLLYVEIDKPNLVIEELIPGLSNKQPKVIAATLTAITAIYHNFGVKIVEPKPILKQVPKVFGHADKNVRAEAQNLTVELYRWLKEAMKPVFWSELKPIQQQDLEKLFDRVKEEPPPKQERLTRAQQAQIASQQASVGNDVGGEELVVDEPEEEEAVEVDAFDLAEPVDAYSKVPADFHDMIASTKWKERKDTLDALFNVLNTPRIKDGPWDSVVHALAKCMKDANIAVVTVAANCIEKLALGVRRAFSKHRSTVMAPVMDRLKEKKQSVTDALSAALDAVFQSTSLTDCLEETLGFMSHKNPNVKLETVKFLVRCLRTTREVPSKAEQKSIADAATKLLTESTEGMRSGGAEILGTLMKIIGERAMGPYLDGLDDIRKTKIKEYFETAEVKAKEKPKPVAAPAPKAGTSKKVTGGTKRPAPAAKKSTPAPPPEESAPAPRPTAKALPKPGGVAKPSLSQPSGLKLGGLNKPTSAASPRRVISPPISQDGDEDANISSPSKFGTAAPGRGFAGRPLARVTAAPLSPPPAPAPAGMSAVEKAELEQLRAEKEHLTTLTDSLRSTNAKLSAEVSELQNQNAQLIEDHTRDVLQIKAKETQLTRARGEVDVLRSEMESVRKEAERYKREVSRLGRESLGRERDDLVRGQSNEEVRDDGRIYEDTAQQQQQPPPPPPYSNGTSKASSAATTLHRNGSATSAGSRPGSTKPVQSQQQGRVGSALSGQSLSPSEEKENILAARRKISPPVASVNGNGRGSPVRAERPTISSREMSREASDAGSNVGGGAGGGGGGGEGKPAENWKRAAEVTSQLKARIEAMKARQGMARH